MSIYSVQLFVKGAEDDAMSLRKSLAQSISKEFELERVFGVNVELDNPQDDLVMALCMVELEDGMELSQIMKLAAMLPSNKKYMPIEFHENNTSAYGFIDAEYYQIYNYQTNVLELSVNSVIGDMNHESPDERYNTLDGRVFYIGYFSDGESANG